MNKLDEVTNTDNRLNFEHAVQFALDEKRMLEIFQRHFEKESSTVEIQKCRLVRLRWRGGTRSVTQYEVTLKSEGVAPRTQILTGSIHDKKDAGHISRKLSRISNSTESADSVFPPASAIADLNMLVQPFPYDRRLPTLTAIAEGIPQPVRDALSVHFQAEQLDYDRPAINLVRYRAGLAAVLRIDLPVLSPTSPTKTRTVFAKVFRNGDEARKSFDQLSSLAMKADKLDVGFVRVIGLVPSHSTLILEGVIGLTLEDVVFSDLDPKRIKTAAKAIADLNKSKVELPSLHDANAQTACLSRSAERLCQARPDLSDLISHICNKTSKFPAVSLRPTHRDLKPEHIFFTGDNITLIDCDSMAMADPMIDPAMLLARMSALQHQQDANNGEVESELTRAASVRVDLQAASETFIEEYLKHVPSECQRRLNQHYVGALVEISVGFFGRQEPGWRKTIERLLHEAKASLKKPRFG